MCATLGAVTSSIAISTHNAYNKKYSYYSNEYSNLHNYKQETTNTNKQNTDFLSTRRAAEDNYKQPVPYLIFGTNNINGLIEGRQPSKIPTNPRLTSKVEG